jgi:hypothetical protein
VLIRSDGCAVAVGDNAYGQCDIPPLNEGMTYTQISAGGKHTVLIRSDGCAVAVGDNAYGQCNIPSPVLGTFYITDVTHGRDVVLQLEFVREWHHPDMLHFLWGRMLPFDLGRSWCSLGGAQKDCPWHECQPPKSPARFARWAVVGQSLLCKSRGLSRWGESKYSPPATPIDPKQPLARPGVHDSCIHLQSA